MGGTAGAKTRMGSAPMAPVSTASAPAMPAAPAAESAGATPRKRMSGALSNGTTAGAPSAPVGASPAVASVSSTPSGRAGTPGPAGAATPAPRQRRWVKPVVLTVGLLVLAAAVVLGARWLRTLEGVQEFLVTYDGHASQPETAPVGIPGWLGWQHFLNMFFIVLIIRTGLQVRTERKPRPTGRRGRTRSSPRRATPPRRCR